MFSEDKLTGFSFFVNYNDQSLRYEHWTLEDLDVSPVFLAMITKLTRSHFLETDGSSARFHFRNRIVPNTEPFARLLQRKRDP